MLICLQEWHFIVGLMIQNYDEIIINSWLQDSLWFHGIDTINDVANTTYNG
jgi:hypothetical protein